MPAVLETTAQLACAIVLQTSALVVWNVGARDPVGLLRDLVRVRDPRMMLYGFASLAIGLIFIAAATMLIISSVSAASQAFVPTQIFTFMIAIAVDALVGNELRAVARLP